MGIIKVFLIVFMALGTLDAFVAFDAINDMQRPDKVYLLLAHLVVFGLWVLGYVHARRTGTFLKMDRHLVLLGPLLAFGAPFVVVLLCRLEVI